MLFLAASYSFCLGLGFWQAQDLLMGTKMVGCFLLGDFRIYLIQL